MDAELLTYIVSVLDLVCMYTIAQYTRTEAEHVMVCILWNWVWKPLTILFGYFILKNEATALSLNVREQIMRDAVLNPRRRDMSGQGLVVSGPSEW